MSRIVTVGTTLAVLGAVHAAINSVLLRRMKPTTSLTSEAHLLRSNLVWIATEAVNPDKQTLSGRELALAAGA